MSKSYASKEISQLTQEEIKEGKSAFLNQIERCRVGSDQVIMKYSPLRECDYKLGSESVFSRDHLRVCEEYGLTLYSTFIQSHQVYEGHQLVVSTSVFSETDYDKGDMKSDKTHLMRAMNIFIEKDWNQEDVAELTHYRDETASEESRAKSYKKIEDKISKDIDFLKSIFGGKAPNSIMLSSKGYHVHYNLHLSLGWSERGVIALKELSKEIGDERPTRAINFKNLSGLEPEDVEITILPEDSETDPRFDSSSFDLNKVYKKLMDNKLSPAGFDAQVSDIGTRKARECGWWHTKNEHRLVLMKKTFHHLCDNSTQLTKEDILSSFKKKTEKQKESEAKSLIKERKEKLKEFSNKLTDEEQEPRIYLDGSEVITIALNSNSRPYTLQISELISKWDTYEGDLGKNGFIDCRLDFLNEAPHRCGYNTVGSAYVWMWEGSLFIRIRHEKKFPKDEQGNPIKFLMKPTKDYQRRIKTKGFKKKLGLTLNEKTGLPISNISNITKILREDPILRDVIRYNPSTLEFRSHQYSADILYGISESSPFDIKSSYSISGKEEEWALCKRYIEDTYLFTPKSEELKESLKIIRLCGQEFEHLIMSDSWNEFLDCYQGWVEAGKPRLLDTIASGYLDIDKDLNPESYHRNNAFFRSLIISYTKRSCIFRIKQQSTAIKDEILFHIVGQGGRQGKTELFEIIGSCKKRVSLEDKTRLGVYIMKPDSKIKWVSDPGQDGAELRRILVKKEFLVREEISAKIQADTESLKSEISEPAFEARDLFINDYITTPKRYIHCSTSNNIRVFKNDPALLQRLKVIDLDEVGADGRFVIGLLPSDNLNSKPIHGLASDTGGKNLGKLNRDYLLEHIHEDYSRLSLAIGEAFSRSILGEDIPDEVIGCHGKPLKDYEKLTTKDFQKRDLKTGLTNSSSVLIKVEQNKTPASEEPYLLNINKKYTIQTDDDIEYMIQDFFTSTTPFKQGSNDIYPCMNKNFFVKEELQRWLRVKFFFNISSNRLKSIIDSESLELSDGSKVYFKDTQVSTENTRIRAVVLCKDSDRKQKFESNPFLTSQTITRLNQGQTIPEAVISINSDVLDDLDTISEVDALKAQIEALQRQLAQAQASKVETPKVETPKVSDTDQLSLIEKASHELSISVLSSNKDLLKTPEWDKLASIRYINNLDTKLNVLKESTIAFKRLGVKCESILKDLNL